MTQSHPHPSRHDRAWPKGLTIRARSLTDAAAIADLHNLPGYRWGTMRLPYHSVEEIRRGIEQQPADVRSLVAVLDGMVVGDIALLPAKGRRAHVATLGMGVHDNYTRRGIGRALLGEAIGIADDWLNLRRLELTVYADNHAAIALYESFGFTVEGRMADYAFRGGTYVEALAMARLSA
ncbi:GNAT family N-acetyltransferase [Rhizobium rosettiformans]|uniref:GNAT family N-acetyltransferase n=1 Tax=Rhizobium rosettiformans TaxID=1368430 RepID=A0ABX7F155_9HYPH|nr:GNAT family N-acetyltransferase [Rhizobium rosettiformans]QRF53416.1 GNAT family N-acetyltransferase [Rhizobium rosettiformans]